MQKQCIGWDICDHGVSSDHSRGLVILFVQKYKENKEIPNLFSCFFALLRENTRKSRTKCQGLVVVAICDRNVILLRVTRYVKLIFYRRKFEIGIDSDFMLIYLIIIYYIYIIYNYSLSTSLSKNRLNVTRNA